MSPDTAPATPRMPGLAEGFLRSAERYRSRPALMVGDQYHTYGELRELAGRITSTLLDTDGQFNPLVALLAHRSVTAYAAVLGILGAGCGYVPLNPKFPAERLAAMLNQSQCTTVIVGEEALGMLDALLSLVDRPMTIVLPTIARKPPLRAMRVQHRWIERDGIAPAPTVCSVPHVDPDAVAYLLFTSGSTGAPKGVPVSHLSAKSYVAYACERYGPTEHDRFSQMFDMTFDLSVHDMFVCWERGGCLYCVPEKTVMAPAKFIRDHGLTMWFSVPSVVGYMKTMGLLKPDVFPSLRVSLFCGEPFPAAYAEAWQKAASLSIVENLYGPTETTIAITHYRWNPRDSPAACLNGIVPIGWVFDGQESCLIDKDRNAAADGACGELYLAGSQVSRGYWHHPQKTAEQFVRIRSRGEKTWYRTGDVVRQDETGCLFYLGRTDHQVKIRGYRVELQEIDCLLRDVSGADRVASVAWPVRNGVADGIRAFIFGESKENPQELLDRCRQRLPEYMVPARLHVMREVPLNANGKLDRVQLIKFLEHEGG